MPSKPSGPKAPAIKIGEVVLERYRVVEQIGSGGHSVVYKALDERLSRPVCIKIFSGLGGDSGVGRTSYEHFVQEAFALSRLTHPNTLRIYDFGHLSPKDAPKESAGMPLQVCEYMNGGTLSNIVREQGKQSLEETIRVTNAMCAALSEAHGLGIVHRDIKPQNILFGSVGTTMLPKLADFGIAKWSADAEQDKKQLAEDTAIVAGQKLAMYSPSWAAPEQLAGQPVSPATDIYSLAVVAIYMLSGRAIFADEDVYAGYKKRRNAEGLVRDTLVPLAVPRKVIDVLVRALAFDPKKRVTKVDELSSELQAALEPVTEDVPALSPRSSKQQPSVEPITEPVNKATPPHASPVVRFDVKSSVTAATTPMGQDPAPGEGYPSAPEERRTPPRDEGYIEAQPPVPFPAPGPRTPPQSDLTPATYRAPNVAAWMHSPPSTASNAPERRLALMEVPQPVADRRVSFVMIGNDSVDLTGNHGTKVRITLVPGPTGQRVVHVKGVTCFVAILGGRPSPAVHVDRSTDVALVTPRAQEIGHLRIAQPSPIQGGNGFQVGGEAISVGTEDCADPILFDFGPGNEAYFVYTRGRSVPKSSGRRG
jgi:serine/threonine-protein kinase